MQNTCLFYIVPQVLKVLLIESYMIQPVLLFLVDLLWLIYTSPYITFYKVLEIYYKFLKVTLPLSAKIFLSQILLF